MPGVASPPLSRPTPGGAVVLASLLLAVLASAGCRSTQIAARALPAEYRAKPGAGMQRVRLGGLATASTATTALGVEDLVEVTVASGLAGEEPIVQRARVARDGSLDAPLIGPVAVNGVEPTDAAARIAQAAVSRGVFRRPQVSLEVVEQATHRVTVLGAVGEPGVKDLPRSNCDVLSALAAAGGLNEDAGVVVEVLRSRTPTLADAGPDADGEVRQASFDAPPVPRPQAEVIDLSDPNATATGRLRLGDRDVVVVRPKEQRVVHVTGLVAKPAQLELMHEHDLRVLDAIAMAGGTKSSVADKVLVVRQVPRAEQPLVIEVSLARAKKDGAENLILQAGDLVSVESTPATVAVDAVSTFFRITMGVGGNLSLF